MTIPASIREKLGIKEGELMAFVETDQGILISKREAVTMEALDKIGKLLQEHGITLEKLIESGRDIRGELIQEKYGLTEAQWNRSE